MFSSLSITKKFLLLVTPPFLACAIGYSFVLSLVEIDSSQKNEDIQTQVLTERYAHLFVSPMWNIDSDTLLSLAQTVSQEPAIECVFLYEKNLRQEITKVGVCSEDPLSDLIVRNQIIEYQYEEQSINLGELVLHWYRSDTSAVVKKQVYTNLSLTGILVFILFLSTVFAIKKIIINPLKKIESSVVVTDDHANRPLVEMDQEDEIGTFCKVYNSSIDLQNKAVVEIKQSRNIALRAESAQSIFLANISHEIRTPLNTIIGASHILRKSITDEEQGKYLRNIEGAGNHLLGLVNDVIDITRIKSGKLYLSKERFCISDIADSLCIQSRGLLENRDNVNLYINRKYQEETYITGDPVRLTQVLFNFIGNSVKFTSRGAIIVDIEERSKTADNVMFYFSVKDTGIGIEESKLEQVFEAFSQLETDQQTDFEGSGLGLHVSRCIVEAMDSKIEVTSKIARGSEFSFFCKFDFDNKTHTQHSKILTNSKAILLSSDLNLAYSMKYLCSTLGLKFDHHHSQETLISRISLKDDQEVIYFIDDLDFSSLSETSRQKISKSAARIVVIGNSITTQKRKTLGNIDAIQKPMTSRRIQELFFKKEHSKSLHTRKSTLTNTSHRHRILVVDDSQLNREILVEILKIEGFSSILTARSGEEAIDIIENQNINLVLMDIKMPNLNGIEATKLIRQNFDKKDLPILGVSANAFSSDKVHCLNAGMNDFLTKPIDPDALIEKVEFILRGAVGRAEYELSNPDNSPPLEFSNSDIKALLDYENTHLYVYGKGGIYLKTLKKFLSKYEFIDTEIQKSIDQDNPDVAMNIVHIAAGLAATIGAMKLRDFCLRCEVLLSNATDLVLVSDYIEKDSHIVAATMEEIKTYCKAKETFSQ